MRVKATRLGYDGFRRRRENEVFEISDKKDKNGKVIAFSETWMVPAEDIPVANNNRSEKSAIRKRVAEEDVI